MIDKENLRKMSHMSQSFISILSMLHDIGAMITPPMVPADAVEHPIVVPGDMASRNMQSGRK